MGEEGSEGEPTTLKHIQLFDNPLQWQRLTHHTHILTHTYSHTHTHTHIQTHSHTEQSGNGQNTHIHISTHRVIQHTDNPSIRAGLTERISQEHTQRHLPRHTQTWAQRQDHRDTDRHTQPHTHTRAHREAHTATRLLDSVALTRSQCSVLQEAPRVYYKKHQGTGREMVN